MRPTAHARAGRGRRARTTANRPSPGENSIERHRRGLRGDRLRDDSSATDSQHDDGQLDRGNTRQLHGDGPFGQQRALLGHRRPGTGNGTGNAGGAARLDNTQRALCTVAPQAPAGHSLNDACAALSTKLDHGSKPDGFASVDRLRAHGPWPEPNNKARHMDVNEYRTPDNEPNGVDPTTRGNSLRASRVVPAVRSAPGPQPMHPSAADRCGALRRSATPIARQEMAQFGVPLGWSQSNSPVHRFNTRSAWHPSSPQ